MEKELNKEQIIKALECCKFGKDEAKCKECNWHPWIKPRCWRLLASNALSLINSQEQRIKELTEEYESMANSVNEASDLIRKLKADKKELTEENERLREDNEIKSQKRANIFEIANAFERGRTDGVRKMQERLKVYEDMTATSPCNFCKNSLRGNRNKRCDEDLQCFGFNKWESVIDQIAKEMVGT